MTSVYNGRIDTANKNEKKNFGMVWDGALFTLDSWVILKGSPNKDAAYKFLDFCRQGGEPGQAVGEHRLRHLKQGRYHPAAAGRAEGPADRAPTTSRTPSKSTCVLA